MVMLVVITLVLAAHYYAILRFFHKSGQGVAFCPVSGIKPVSGLAQEIANFLFLPVPFYE